MQSSLNIALVGASGAVGTEFLKLFELRNFPLKNLKLLSSSRSAGKFISFKEEKIALEKLTDQSFKNIDLAFFAAGAEISLDFVPKAVASGALVIDNSSAFRLDEKVPLIVPSCNMQEAKKNQGIIANPNCSTIQMVEALYFLHLKKLAPDLEQSSPSPYKKSSFFLLRCFPINLQSDWALLLMILFLSPSFRRRIFLNKLLLA